MCAAVTDDAHRLNATSTLVYQLPINERLRLIRSTVYNFTVLLYINATQRNTTQLVLEWRMWSTRKGCTPCRQSRRTCGWRQCAGRRDRAASCAHADSTRSRTVPDTDTEPERSLFWWATRTATRMGSAGRGHAAAPRTAWYESVMNPVYRTGPLAH